MPVIRRGLDLAQEPLGADGVGQLGAQDLERDLAVVLDVVGEVDDSHAARAELALDAVVVRQGGVQGLDRVGQRWSVVGRVCHLNRPRSWLPARILPSGGTQVVPA
jgi:hypothetical protein